MKSKPNIFTLKWAKRLLETEIPVSDEDLLLEYKLANSRLRAALQRIVDAATEKGKPVMSWMSIVEATKIARKALEED